MKPNSYSEVSAYNRWYRENNREQIMKNKKELPHKTLNGRMSRLHTNSRQRAISKGWEYDLDSKFLIDLWHKQGGKCAITGQNMEITSLESRTRSLVVSLDRINNSRGYTRDNVWLTTSKVNYMRGVLSMDDFIEMCKLVLENSK